MRLHIYSMKEKTYKKILDFFELRESFQTEWHPLNQESTLDEEAHFSIFLLDIHVANSQWLNERLKKLKRLGAHDQNFYFILYNKESTNPSDIEKVKEDLKNSLSKNIVNPLIDTIALAAYEAFTNKDSRFAYFDEEWHTIKQVEEGDEDNLIRFNNYLGKNQVNKILKMWLESPFLLIWKNNDLTNFLTYKVPSVIIDKLEERYQFNLIEADSYDEFVKLQRDAEIISLTSVELHEKNLLPNQFLVTKLKDISNKNYLFFDESIYRLVKLPVEKIMEECNLVFIDERGYPKPKAKITNWAEEFARLSGLEKVLERLGECMQR